MSHMDFGLKSSSNSSWVLGSDEMLAHVWGMDVDGLAGDLGSAIVVYCVNLWVE